MSLPRPYPFRLIRKKTFLDAAAFLGIEIILTTVSLRNLGNNNNYLIV